MTLGLRFWRRQRADAAPRACPICLDSVPADNGAVTLHCGHAFCRDCLVPYVKLKIRERLVENDQLVCPVVECRRRLRRRDLRRVLATPEAFGQYQSTLQRVRDEKNPRARWCPRTDCSELVVCWSSRAKTFTCPKCATVGCGRCRGLAHAPGERCHGTPLDPGDEDQSEALYRQWEQSLARGSWWGATGDTRAVRACPKCHMRIWKNGGCKHMTCTYCKHEFCWECAAKWSSRHYACGTATAATPAETGDAPQVGVSGGDILLLLFGLVFVVVIRHAMRGATTRGSADRPAVATAAPRVQVVAYRQHELPPRRRIPMPAWVRRVKDAVSLAVWTLFGFVGRVVFEIIRAVHSALEWVCAWFQQARRMPPRVWQCVDALKRAAHAAALLYVRSLLWLLTWIGRVALVVAECAARVGQYARAVYQRRIAGRQQR